MQPSPLPISKLALFTGLIISATAAWYSITGLAILFAGAFWAVVTMGVVLELGKLVAASWIYRNWRQAPFFLKSYLVSAVLVLMLITAIGIFGFLSKAHLSQQTATQLATADVSVYDVQIKQHEQVVSQSQRTLERLDTIANKYTNSATEIADLEMARQLQRNQLKERRLAQADLLASQKEIQRLVRERAPSATIATNLQAEVGPIKYVAELFYGQADPQTLDKAVRLMILAIVFAFDPLAVLLIIAANTKGSGRDANGRFLPKTANRLLWTDARKWLPKR